MSAGPPESQEILSMSADNPVRVLKSTHPDLEIWWDSSPLVYADWLAGAGQAFRETGLFDVEGEMDRGRFSPASLLQGATTNQPLTWQVLDKYSGPWTAWIAKQQKESPGLTAKEAMWQVFIEVAARGADMLEPIFAASQHQLGQICCQVDPRDMADLDAMLVQARRIHAARPNIMVKIPGTKEGVEAVRILTAEGIPTNVTLGFTVAQLIAVAEAARAGLAEAQRRGTDLSRWRSCAVMMLGRYEDAPPMKAQARELGIELTDAHLRWAGIAIFRKAYQLYQERAYATKLMAASMRLGPVVDGAQRVWHLEKLAGAGAVMTVFPNIFEAFLTNYAGEAIEPQAEQPVPSDVLECLLRIPYFAQAYDEKGLAPDEFNGHPALQITAASFVEAMEKVETFAAGSLRRAHA
jgi:transaldolase